MLLLLQLDLRGNGLGNDGAIRISRGLRSHQNKNLAELDLGYNEVKDDGACALAQVGIKRGVDGPLGEGHEADGRAEGSEWSRV